MISPFHSINLNKKCLVATRTFRIGQTIDVIFRPIIL
jgi:hypothetical protein